MASLHLNTPAHSHLHPKPKPVQFHHLTIDGTGTKSYASPSQYQHAVLPLLERMYQTRTGRAVFHEFTRHPSNRPPIHLMMITPYEAVQLNAYAEAKDLLHATLKGQVERSGANGQMLLDAQGKSITGQGGGSDSDVSFTPVIWTKYCNQNKHAHRSGAQPDEILFHEMTHATRQMRGVFDPQPLGFLYDTEEEFFAILLANIYASETGRSLDLRSDHHTFEHLTTDTNATFLPKKDASDYRYRLVEKLIRQEPKMAHELNMLKHVSFNPIRRYHELQRTSVQVKQPA
ncbi:MAG: M91 family zinc metallopeptidase [Aliidongia sp.]